MLKYYKLGLTIKEYLEKYPGGMSQLNKKGQLYSEGTNGLSVVNFMQYWENDLQWHTAQSCVIL